MAAGPRKTRVHADINRNTLFITLNGTILIKDVETIYSDVRFGVADLQPGFAVVTDLSQCRIGSLAGIATFRKIMDFLVANKVGQVIRIVGKAKVIFKQMSRITETVTGYSPIYVATAEEAENLLAEQHGSKTAAEEKTAVG